MFSALWFTSTQTWVSSPQSALLSHVNTRAAPLIHAFSCCSHSPEFYGSNKTSGCHPLRSGRTKTSRCESTTETHRVECLGHFTTHCREKRVEKCVISTSPFVKLPNKQKNEKLCACMYVLKTKRKWELLTLITELWNYMLYYIYTFNYISYLCGE